MYDNVKLLMDEEGYQLVPIPDEYPFNTDEVFVNDFGGHITIAPVDNAEAAFMHGAALLGEDFMADEYPDERFEASGKRNGKETEHEIS